MSGYTQNIIFLLLNGLFFACSAPTSLVEPTDILHDEVTIGEIHQAYGEGTLSVSDVVEFYLKRIEDIDRSGPGLTSVIIVNPQSRQLAGRMDSILAQPHFLPTSLILLASLHMIYNAPTGIH